MKKMFKFFCLLSFLLIAACSGGKKESPVIYFSNLSEKPIKNINCAWIGNRLSLKALNPGDTRSQSFYITRSQDFFGPVQLSWTNGLGHVIKKEFYFLNKHLPSVSDSSSYSYVQIYFDQFDAEIISSDIVDLTGKTKRMDQALNHYHDSYLNGTKVPDAVSLIRVEPIQKAPGLPTWLENMQ